MKLVIWRRSSKAFCLWRTLKVAAILLLLIFVVMPIRNTVLYFVLPKLWMEQPSLFLLKVMTHNQYFPIEQTPLGQNPAPIQVDLKEIEQEQYQLPAYPAFHAKVKELKEKAEEGDAESEQELQELMRFQPQMVDQDRAVFLFTLKVFTEACKAANLTWFLISGSALGAIRHHGMIPWDDDVDIVMNGSEWITIRNVLSDVKGFDLFTPSYNQWKFFMHDLPQGNRPFKWPNLDIFFFAEDDTYIWATTWGAKGSLANKKTDVFPLTTKKFEIFQLPVARYIKSLITAEYGDYHSGCKTAEYVHKTNEKHASTSLVSIDCAKLHKVFPFVFYATNADGAIVEQLQVDGKPV
ncbi:lipopolysaccharide cholinephosphotransferase licd [Plakobranchus ocellatus]|uniref:Lipopolysaccharide cholinephosphotransferase licd n=1 Tax=Plakobranchus ocellatus TaxID=259542 RepID=A0AAV4C0D0_9GAST|nr:lipopolysaccharide cholinephosphotransferase licd [Plakobranchus ocellatus]